MAACSAVLRAADGADANALQAPLQYRLPDWDLGSTGCFDQASLKGLQDALADLDSFADGNADAW